MTGERPSPPARVENDLLARIAVALEPYLDEIVLCGGWVPYLYWARHPEPGREAPLRTQDADFAVPRQLDVVDDQTIAERLRTIGARSRMAGYGKGVVKFELDHDDATIPIEFIAPLHGDGRESAVEVQQGLRVEPLRYVDLLLERTERITLVRRDADTSQEATVRIPGAGMFIAQKMLIARRRRDRSRRGKDLAYVHDLLANYGELQPTILGDLAWLRRARAGWFSSLEKELDQLFSGDAPLGSEWMLALIYPQGLPEELPRQAALRRLAQPFLHLMESMLTDDEASP